MLSGYCHVQANDRQAIDPSALYSHVMLAERRNEATSTCVNGCDGKKPLEENVGCSCVSTGKAYRFRRFSLEAEETRESIAIDACLNNAQTHMSILEGHFLTILVVAS